MRYDLHKYFYPTIDKTGNKNRRDVYSEYIPRRELAPYIRCFWTSTINYDQYTKEVYFSRIIPDGCMDIIFSNNILTSKIESIFVGINDKPFFSESRGDTESFAIRFYPWAAHLILNIDMKELRNSIVSLEVCLKEFSDEFSYNLMKCSSVEEKIQIAEAYLLDKLSTKSYINNNLMNAMFAIVQSYGNIPVDQIAQYVCISRRQLERLFNSYIGLSPKAMSQVVRFQSIFQKLILNENHDWSEIAFRHKYSDQSHFIRDFKRFYGSSPTEVFK